MRTPPSPGHALQHGIAPLFPFFNQHGLALAVHSRIARCDLAVPKKGPRLGICTAKAGPFPPHYRLSAGAGTQHTSAALTCTATPSLCRSALGAKTHRPAVPSRVIQSALPGRWLFLVFWFRLFSPRQVLRGPPRADGLQDSALAPFSAPLFWGFSLCGRVLPILRTAVPPSLSSAKMSQAIKRLPPRQPQAR